MTTLKLTSKRQATFPASTCEELGVGPGDQLELEKIRVRGKDVWVLRKQEPLSLPWLEITRPWVKRKNHDWETIKSEIESARLVDARRHALK